MEADKKNHTDLKIKHEDLIKTNLLIFVMLGMFLLKIHLYPSIILSTSTVAFVALFISTYARLNLNIELISTTTENTKPTDITKKQIIGILENKKTTTEQDNIENGYKTP